MAADASRVPGAGGLSDVDVTATGRDGSVATFEVRSAGRTYRVTVADADAAALAPGCPVTELVSESFRFLLEREPASSILQTFDLAVIERYFPGYREQIAARLRG